MNAHTPSRPLPVAVLDNLIEGRATPSAGGGRRTVVSAYDGRTVCDLPAGDPRDVDAAVASALAAFEDGRWSRRPPSWRKACLLRWADAVQQHAAELDLLDAADMGKPVSVGAYSARSAADLIRFNAEAIDKVFGETLPSADLSLVLQRWTPRGVVAAITPWNFPVFNVALKVAPALAAGNTVVLKPSELSPRSAQTLAALALDAGVPPGVFNVVQGDGEVVGQALSRHPDVAMTAFTGSTEVGRLVLTSAAQSNLRPVVAECGGKSPHVVVDDGVDLAAVAARIAGALVTNQGQICSVGSRLIVQASAAERLVDEILVHFEALVPGDPCDPGTTFGPLCSATQRDRVAAFIDGARESGARVIEGGPPTPGGAFVRPVIVFPRSTADVIWREEVFGPVLSVMTFDDIDEAIGLANSTAYGLLAYVWSKDLVTGMRLADGIRSSVVLNAAPPAGEGPGHGFSSEPVAASGLGVEGGVEGLKSYLRRQTVWINY
ncbi:aldehyde dehydrogenase family protein [Phenylobacterium sp.]|uniref:aldehyde dehydrogenase family protein n=1 Tax=Phenylobacterium sp. TaxID=1871053 RepID=UPI0025F79AE0|nr:aldehyde dehydrogenase family protein [Phenylobacterium sp.]